MSKSTPTTFYLVAILKIESKELELGTKTIHLSLQNFLDIYIYIYVYFLYIYIHIYAYSEFPNFRVMYPSCRCSKLTTIKQFLKSWEVLCIKQQRNWLVRISESSTSGFSQFIHTPVLPWRLWRIFVILLILTGKNLFQIYSFLPCKTTMNHAFENSCAE